MRLTVTDPRLRFTRLAGRAVASGSQSFTFSDSVVGMQSITIDYPFNQSFQNVQLPAAYRAGTSAATSPEPA
jgi:hypothetical protein